MNHEHSCYCGTAEKVPHETGKDGCQRFIVDPPPDDITEYTAKHQRGYHQHPCGCWSRWEGSTNSLEA